MAHQNTISTIPFDGGVLCFDFINTVRSRKIPEMHNYLALYADFIVWAGRAEILPAPALHNLSAYGRENPEKAAAALAHIISVRENLYVVFSAIAAEITPDTSVLAVFNRNLGQALSQVYLHFPHNYFSLAVAANEKELESPLNIIWYSAYQILNREDPKRIKECAECGWVFLDKTKNGKRQWCNPGYCGSTSKARRYYYRQKEKGKQLEKE